jgi:excisionase family DNA binding protein
LKTVKQLAAELNISKSTLHRLIHDNNIETIQQGNKRLIDETIEATIIKALKEKTLQSETIQSDSETVQKRFKNDSEMIQKNDYETKYIQQLEQQILDLKADKQYLQERLTTAEQERASLTQERDKLTQERDKLTKERQTILAELLELKQPKEIELKAPAEPTTAATTKRPAQRPQSERQQPHRKQSMLDSLFKAFRRR